MENDEDSFLSHLREFQESDTVDTSFLQKLMVDEDRFKETLVKLNDQAVHEIQTGNSSGGLKGLEKLKKILEFVAENGKPLDRNIIIVCLYNMASAYQTSWVLEKCAEYIDAVVYNLNQSIKQDEVLITSCAADLNSSQITTLISIKIRKEKFLLKVYLQYCAVLSQLSKHEEALTLIHKAQKVMIGVLSQCGSYCKEARDFLERDSQSVPHQDSNGRMSNMSFLGISFDFYKNFEKSSTFYDEVPFLKQTLEYAIPFLNNFIATIKKFSSSKIEDTLKQTRKLLFNWKNNPENTEKYLRKEFGKSSFFKDGEDKNRSLLGLQTTPEWIQSLNIGSFMHMKPLKYKDYAEKRELVSQLTKDSLQEKVVLQSLIYFSTATEIRFLKPEDPGSASSKSTADEPKASDSQQMSEAYHLAAIELICKYISGACPYLNHLISSYQKHYNQDLETIPEESFFSLAETIPAQESLDDFEEKVIPTRPSVPVGQQKVDKNLKKDKRPKFEFINPAGPKLDQNLLRRGSENTVANFRRPKSGLVQRVKSVENEKKESEVGKHDNETRKIGVVKHRDFGNKKLLKAQKDDEEAKKIYENSLSSTSLTFGNILSKSLNPPVSGVSSNKNFASTLPKHEASSSIKNPTKKVLDIPNLGLTKALKGEKDPQKPSGCRSDRSNQKNEDLSPKIKMAERKMLQKEQLQGGINFYLYKNFNKFIQNLYVKNGDSVKLKSKKHKQEKLATSPSSRDTLFNYGRKSSLNKTTGANLTGHTTRGNLSSSKFTHSTEPDESPCPKKEGSVGIPVQRYSSHSPKKESDDISGVILNKKKKNFHLDKPLKKSQNFTSPKSFHSTDALKTSIHKGLAKNFRPGDS